MSIDKDLWEQAKQKAAKNCQSLSKVIKMLLKNWLTNG